MAERETKPAPVDTIVDEKSGPRPLPSLPPPVDPVQALGGRGAPLRYREGELIGTGGMGQVVSATDEMIGREIALKRLARHVDGLKDLRARFLREALIQARLNHPSVLPVHDIGVDAEGRPFFTMPRVRGRTLRELLNDKPDAFQRRRMISALAHVCLAVDYAHQHGFVHRDLKPPNIMLGDFGEVYVLDWGVAREVSGDDVPSEPRLEPRPAESKLTEAGAQLGTPGYMSPEQVRSASDVGPAGDVYALGAMVFEVLASEPLHAGSRDERIKSTLAGVDGHPSSRVPDLDISPELDAAVARATSLDPEERGSARALADAIEEWLGGARDREQRHAWADQLRAEAERAEERGDVEGRRDAIRLLGRSVALEPDHRETLERLIALLTDDTAPVPDHVSTELLRDDETRIRRSGRYGTYGFLGAGALTLVLSLAMGVRRPGVVVAMLLVAAFSSGLSAWIARSGKVRHWAMLALFFTTFAFGAFLSGFFGPFVGVPSFVALLAGLYVMDSPRLTTWVAVAGVTALIAPLALELAGILPPSFEVTAGSIVLHPRLVAFHSPSASLLTLFALNAAALFAPILMARMRAREDRFRRREAQRNWRLRQLLPEERRSTVPPPKRDA